MPETRRERDISTRWTSVGLSSTMLISGQDKLVCFGGMSDTDPMSVYGDIWLFDCQTRKWLPQPTPLASQDPLSLPSSRYAHLSSVSRGKLVVSGGQRSDNS